MESSSDSSSSFMENNFAGLAISKRRIEHEDDDKLPSPIMCYDENRQEMLMSSSENSVLQDCDMEHEVAPSGNGKVKEALAVNVIKPETPQWRRKHKKNKKKPNHKQKNKPSGRQHGKSKDYGGKKDAKASENCNHTGMPINHSGRKSNYQQRGQSRECQGDDSDSDEDTNRDTKLPRGHYAGIEQQEDEPMSVESHQNTPKEVGATAHLVAQEPPVPEICQLLDRQEVGFQRILQHRSQGIDLARIPALISRKCIHCSHTTNCENCTQPDLCILVRGLITHYRSCPIKDVQCKNCQFVVCGVMQHSINCDNRNCEVPDCQFYRKSLLERNQRKTIEGEVIHSTTTIFKEGQTIRRDVDYTFLHKKKLGHGSHGDVHRVWFYHLPKEVEADIVAKEVKYDPEDEAKIHNIFRHDHPNLLGAIMVVRFTLLCNEMKMKIHNEKKTLGYVFMERGERTLHELKIQYRKKYECGLPIKDAVYYFRQTLEGLRFLHEKQIVHKDIKDMNLMLFGNNQRIKISDWDGALFIENEMSASDMQPVGTPGFCAPEVLDRKPHGYPADIFSAAIMLLELLYGGQYKKKDDTSYEQVLMRRRDALDQLKREYPELGTIIEGCLSDNPADRPTACQLVHNPLLGNNAYKVNLPLRCNSGGNGDVESADFCHYADLRGEVGNNTRSRVTRLSAMTDSQISVLMDELPKVLPSENVPQSNDWVGTASVEEASEQSEPVESMDTL